MKGSLEENQQEAEQVPRRAPFPERLCTLEVLIIVAASGWKQKD